MPSPALRVIILHHLSLVGESEDTGASHRLRHVSSVLFYHERLPHANRMLANFLRTICLHLDSVCESIGEWVDP